MCLLIALTRLQTSFPLVVGANRDELYERPALPMAVLRGSAPRILGGRDEAAGGTWLAVNAAGVFAAVTNRPTSAGKDPAKRSRGELPLMLARHLSAPAAVEHFRSAVDPSHYNPGWFLVGDRQSLFALDMCDGSSVHIESLPPGVHVLENRPFGAESAKVERVRELLGDVSHLSAADLEARLEEILSDHEISASAEGGDTGGFTRPAQVDALCVHTDRYGTRWSGLVSVPASPRQPPRFRYCDGAPCHAPFGEATSLW